MIQVFIHITKWDTLEPITSKQQGCNAGISLAISDTLG